MKSRFLSLQTLTLFLLTLCSGWAQTSTDPNEGLTLTRNPSTETFFLRWWGKIPGTYFLKYSNNLVDWNYFPNVIAGNNEPVEWEIDGYTHFQQVRFFFKLQYSDTPTIDPWADDFDLDGVPNFYEAAQGTDPLSNSTDIDGDGMCDDFEKFYFGALTATGADDNDGDGLSDLGEYLNRTNPSRVDSDDDGLLDGQETARGTNPLIFDTDGDTMGDGWEVTNGLNPLVPDTSSVDTDVDGLSNLQEYQLGTSPLKADTDGDGLSDSQEVALELDPKFWDTNGNGMSDKFEVQYQLVGADPEGDADNDGLTNLQEYTFGASPNNTDTDSDGVGDGTEATNGSDPADASDGGVAPGVNDTITLAFEIKSSGKSPVGTCAVCHNLSVSVGTRLLKDGESLTLPRGKARDIKLIDKPDPYQGGTGVAPHDTARFILWPQAVDSQTLVPTPDKSFVAVTKDNILEYLIDNREALMTEDSAWQDAVLAKKAIIHSSGIKLAADANRDGQIDTTYTSDETKPNTPFWYLINEDDDAPGVTPQRDFENAVVDGEGDLTDFFPVVLNIKEALTIFPPGSSVSYKLKHSEGGLSFIYTSLGRATAFSFRNGSATTGYGPLANEPVVSATTQQITATGVELNAAFLNRIITQGDGVILVEGRSLSSEPLILSVEKDGQEIFQTALHLSSLRLRTESGEVHHGFDPPNKDEVFDVANPSTYFASVVQGTTNSILRLDLPGRTMEGLQWKIDSADVTKVNISPRPITSPTSNIVLTGLGTGLTAPTTTTITLAPVADGSPAVLTLKVVVLPMRELQLAIYVLEDPNSPASQFGSSPVVPSPDFSAILATTNDTFKQAGVHFTLHSSSGTYQYPYDTKGINWDGTSFYLARYSDVLPTRIGDGQMTIEEREAFLADGNSSVANTIFPVPENHPTIRRFILIKESGIPYSDNPGSPMIRGYAGGPLVFARNNPGQVDMTCAHELGHQLGLASADDDGGGHDQPPYPYLVVVDQPNGNAPVHPGNSFVSHKPTPNYAIMQGGAPEVTGLPWLYGRWMRNEDWIRANRAAGGLSP